MNKNIIISILIGSILFSLFLVMFILFTKTQIQTQTHNNIQFEKQAFYINNIKTRYNQQHQKAIESMMKESSIHKKVLGKKISFKAFNIKFRDFDRIANKILNSSIIIESLVIVRKKKDQVDLKLVVKQ